MRRDLSVECAESIVQALPSVRDVFLSSVSGYLDSSYHTPNNILLLIIIIPTETFE